MSLIAGLVQDKCVYYPPLYRQHQRLAASGITVSRQLLSTWVHRAAELLRPIHDAQLRSILQSKVLAMDDTPIRAGRDHAKHKMKRAYLWPVYGDRDEVTFTFSTTRGRAHVLATLGGFAGTLLCDGHEAYLHYAQITRDVTHAQCWAHTRRHFEGAQSFEPDAVAEALALIGELYRVEKHIRKEGLSGEAKLACRIEHARPVCDAFFAWCDQQCHRLELLPKDPFSIALAYAMQRRGALSVYLSDPEVAIDTNHIERAIRPIAIARKTGASAGPRLVPSASPSCTAWSPLAGCTACTPTPTWSMCCSALRPIRIALSRSSFPDAGLSCSPPTLYAPTWNCPSRTS